MIDQFICRYGKHLYGLCIPLCAGSLEADDLYQDTRLGALKNCHQYDQTKIV